MTPDAMKEYRQRWATAIRAHRTEVLRVTQEQLADLLAVSQSTVAMWERAEQVPLDLMKIRVIYCLGLNPKELLRPLSADPTDRLVREWRDRHNN